MLMTMSDDHPHERLRSARERAGFASAAEAARAFGWPDSRYRHHENGTRGIPLKHAEAYGRAYKVSPSWIVGFKPDEDLSKREKLESSLFSLDDVLSIKDLDQALLDRFGIALIPRISTSRLIGGAVSVRNPFEPLIMDKSQIEALVPDLKKVGLRLQAVDIDTDLRWSRFKPGSMVIIDRRYATGRMSDHLWLVGLDAAVSICPIEADGDDILILDESGETINRVHKTQLDVWGRVVWAGGAFGTFGIDRFRYI